MDNLDFNQAWKKINEEKFSTSTLKKEDIMEAILKESSSTISELKKRLKYKLYWLIFFIAVFTAIMLWNWDKPVVLAFLGVFSLLYCIGGYSLFREVNKMDDYIDASKDTLTEMKKHRDIMNSALRNERKWGMVAFPVMFVSALILPRMLKGTPFKELITDPVFLITVIVLTTLVTFLGQWAAKKMNTKGYGSYMDDLGMNIKKMEEL
ncbi:hypothetical protein BN863_27320 [Formosa agariphila KMM 3901]|uniref:Transmembrane protein n=1 Tax=Formosa agariphila (strain DSM 15362 / KCTC 12365 / LMG 23005 / KMM 3901 / M-2Alg 35-1) TaxID=1347342 RepID=T2KR27_FORAG|nr:hypothetical protein [Formosa agariphila]CDF80444.1 hypothetical protein BN863_27320 [Formosa agariphila KMM 3901]